MTSPAEPWTPPATSDRDAAPFEGRHETQIRLTRADLFRLSLAQLGSYALAGLIVGLSWSFSSMSVFENPTLLVMAGAYALMLGAIVLPILRTPEARLRFGFAFDAEGFTLEHEHGRQELKWEAIQGLRERGWAFVLTAGGRTVPLPKRDLDEAAQDALRKLLVKPKSRSVLVIWLVLVAVVLATWFLVAPR